MSTEGCFPFIIYHLVWFISQIHPYLRENVKKADLYAGAPLTLKTSIFNLRYLSHFDMEFYARKTSR